MGSVMRGFVMIWGMTCAAAPIINAVTPWGTIAAATLTDIVGFSNPFENMTHQTHLGSSQILLGSK